MLPRSAIKFPSCFKSGQCCEKDTGLLQQAQTTEYLLALNTAAASTSWAVKAVLFPKQFWLVHIVMYGYSPAANGM